MRIGFLSTTRGRSFLRGVPRLVALLVVLFAAPAYAQVQSATLVLTSPSTAAPGERIEVTVGLGALVNVTELAAVKFAVAYDPDVLAPVDATPGPALGAWPLADFAAFDGPRGFVIDGQTASPVAVSAGLLVTVRFDVVPGAIDGAVSALRIVGTEPGDPAILLDDLASLATGIKVSTVGSDVAVVGGAPCSPGDVDLDGSLTTADAVIVLRSVIGLVDLDALPRCNADANADGSVDTGDAVRILRTVVGLPKGPAARAAVAWLQRTDSGVRLVISPGIGVFGVQAELELLPSTSIGPLTPPAHGVRVDRAEGAVHRIAWASGFEPIGDAGPIVIELPLRGAGEVDLAGLRIFDAVGEAIPLQVSASSVLAGDRFAALRLASHPNPFNPSTKVRFELPRHGFARLELFNAAGQRVRVLVDGELGAGTHELVWNGTDDGGRSVASGVYYARLSTVVGDAQHRLLLVK